MWFLLYLSCTMDPNIRACHPRLDDAHRYISEKDCAVVGLESWRGIEDIKTFKCVYLGRGEPGIPVFPGGRNPAGADHEQEQNNRNAS